MSIILQKKNHFFLSITAAALLVGIADGVVTVLRIPSYNDLIAFFIAPLCDAFLTFVALGALGAALSGAISLCRWSEAAASFLSRPCQWLIHAWTAQGTREESADRIRTVWGALFGFVIAVGSLGAFSYYAVSTFHEPLRISLLIAASGFLLVPVGYRIGRGLLGVASRQLGRILKPDILWLGRITAGLLLLAPLAGLTVTLWYADDIFGALDPAPEMLLILFLVLVSLFAYLLGLRSEIRLPRRILQALKVQWVLLAAAGLLMISITLIALVISARSPISEQGALGRIVNLGISKALDMDGDGFAWIIGGDCHPWDPRSNPLAIEIPKNRYDEDCDGSDAAPTAAALQDPLNQLRAPREVISRKGNILFIIIDSVRKDHVSLYGYKRKTTPAIDWFSTGAFIFENAFSASNHTSLSMPSLFTGLHPSAFEAARTVNWSSFSLTPKDHSIAQVLDRSGYSTIMYAGHRENGFLQGFEFLNDRPSKKGVNAEPLCIGALEHLKKLGPNPGKPVFFAMHIMDPHHSYMAQKNPNRFGTKTIDRYDGEIAYSDDSLKPILQLVGSPAYSRWLVVILSDHGESFMEHGTFHHGFSMYTEEVQTPLIMRVPGLKGGRIKLTISHVDIAPTLFEWAGIPLPRALPGRSLLGYLSQPESSSPPLRIAFAESYRTGTKYAAYDSRYTLIVSRDTNTWQLYDRKADPREVRNIFTPQIVPYLKRALTLHMSWAEKQPAKQPAKPPIRWQRH